MTLVGVSPGMHFLFLNKYIKRFIIYSFDIGKFARKCCLHSEKMGFEVSVFVNMYHNQLKTEIKFIFILTTFISYLL